MFMKIFKNEIYILIYLFTLNFKKMILNCLKCLFFMGIATS